MIKVVNLLTEEEQYYGKSVSPETAVRTAYALENGQNTAVALGMLDVFPVWEGEETVSCGNWVARKVEPKDGNQSGVIQ